MRKILILCITLSILGCSNADNTDAITGYIEGDYRYITAPEPGWLDTVNASEGTRVADDQLLIVLDNKTQSLAVEKANAQLEEAKSTLDNLFTGARKEELLVLRKEQTEVGENLKLAQITLRRYEQLVKSGATAVADVDQARTQVSALKAKIATLDAQIKAQALPARQPQIDAAKAAVNAQNLAVEQAQDALSKRFVKPQFAGEVTDIYYRKGEFVTTGKPIAQILPDDARKVIFFIPEPKLTQIKQGDKLLVKADNAQDRQATITRISTVAEYAPPVLYSDSVKGRLLFRVEAKLVEKPSDSNLSLPIGIPVKIILRGEHE